MSPKTKQPIHRLVDAAIAEAGTRPRGIADLCHVFDVLPACLANWVHRGAVPVARRELFAAVCKHYEVEL